PAGRPQPATGIRAAPGQALGLACSDSDRADRGPGGDRTSRLLALDTTRFLLLEDVLVPAQAVDGRGTTGTRRLDLKIVWRQPNGRLSWWERRTPEESYAATSTWKGPRSTGIGIQN